MKVGRDPGRVVKRAGLNERDRAVCQAMAVNVRAAVATEEPVERLAARAAMILVAAWTAALDAELILGHGDVHRECGTRVLAAGLAMADHLHPRLGVRAAAHGTAEAPSLDRRHRIFSCMVLPTVTSLARNSGEVMRQMGHYGPKHGKGSSELGWRERQLQCPFRVNRAIFAMSVASPLCPNIHRESGHPGGDLGRQLRALGRLTMC